MMLDDSRVAVTGSPVRRPVSAALFALVLLLAPVHDLAQAPEQAPAPTPAPVPSQPPSQFPSSPSDPSSPPPASTGQIQPGDTEQANPPAGDRSNPIAIVPIEAVNTEARVSGGLQVTKGTAYILTSGSVTSGFMTTNVVLPRRGVLRVCAATTLKLAADTAAPAGETPGLLMAFDHGAIETSFATGRDSDVLLTPDFRILIAGPGPSEVKVRLGEGGDTCVDNGYREDSPASPGQSPDVSGPYVVVSSVFGDGVYRVKPGQRVMFERGSLKQVVDMEKEPCGCPPPRRPDSNEFPMEQSAGLSPLPPAPPAPNPATKPGIKEPLVYPRPEPKAPEASAAASPEAPAAPAVSPASPPTPAPTPASAKKKKGFFHRVGGFFRRVFGAE